MSVISLQQHALDVKRRLWNPAGGRASAEIDIVSETEKRRRLRDQAAAMLEARRAQQDFERARAAGELLLNALQQRAQTIAIARRLLLEEEPVPTLTIGMIMTAVCAYYGVSSVDLRSARRTSDVVIPRQVTMHLCRIHTLCSYPQISHRLGKRDHTTALHAFRRIKGLMEGGDVRLAADIDNIKWELGIR
jgi:chromosomal replication initiation ATPase DnaA